MEIVGEQAGIAPAGRPYLIAAVVFAYWTGFTASPLRATPGKLLTRLQVVTLGGGRVQLWRAALRAATMTLSVFAAMGIAQWEAVPGSRPVALAGLSLLILAIVTSRRQAGHDIAMRTLVVKRRAIRHPEIAGMLRDPTFVCWGSAGSIRGLVEGLAVVMMAAGTLYVTGTVTHDRDRHARLAYALREAQSLTPQVEAFYQRHGRFPVSAQELGVPSRIPYPAGGGYALEADGNIRIGFDVLPDLKRTSIVLQPKPREGKLWWTCAAEGAPPPRPLPYFCRDGFKSSEPSTDCGADERGAPDSSAGKPPSGDARETAPSDRDVRPCR